ncbi:MAG: hypothetical protein ACO3JL_13175 [Myxococcota bacterium]
MTTSPLLPSAQRHEPLCTSLAEALSLRFHFDAVYCAVSASIDGAEVSRAEAVLRAELPHHLDRDGFSVASRAQRDLVMWAGGLERNQKVFCGDVLAPATVFACLWPWSEDDGCTLRVGLWHPEARMEDRQGFEGLLRAWFRCP